MIAKKEKGSAVMRYPPFLTLSGAGRSSLFSEQETAWRPGPGERLVVGDPLADPFAAVGWIAWALLP